MQIISFYELKQKASIINKGWGEMSAKLHVKWKIYKNENN